MLTKDKSKLLALPNSLILGDSSTKNQNPLRRTDFVETAQAASYNSVRTVHSDEAHTVGSCKGFGTASLSG